jgi:hypothetical protein
MENVANDSGIDISTNPLEVIRALNQDNPSIIVWVNWKTIESK